MSVYKVHLLMSVVCKVEVDAQTPEDAVKGARLLGNFNALTVGEPFGVRMPIAIESESGDKSWIVSGPADNPKIERTIALEHGHKVGDA